MDQELLVFFAALILFDSRVDQFRWQGNRMTVYHAPVKKKSFIGNCLVAADV